MPFDEGWQEIFGACETETDTDAVQQEQDTAEAGSRSNGDDAEVEQALMLYAQGEIERAQQIHRLVLARLPQLPFPPKI